MSIYIYWIFTTSKQVIYLMIPHVAYWFSNSRGSLHTILEIWHITKCFNLKSDFILSNIYWTGFRVHNDRKPTGRYQNSHLSTSPVFTTLLRPSSVVWRFSHTIYLSLGQFDRHALCLCHLCYESDFQYMRKETFSILCSRNKKVTNSTKHQHNTNR